jgi:hypothetical protein
VTTGTGCARNRLVIADRDRMERDAAGSHVDSAPGSVSAVPAHSTVTAATSCATFFAIARHAAIAARADFAIGATMPGTAAGAAITPPCPPRRHYRPRHRRHLHHRCRQWPRSR